MSSTVEGSSELSAPGPTNSSRPVRNKKPSFKGAAALAAEMSVGGAATVLGKRQKENVLHAAHGSAGANCCQASSFFGNFCGGANGEDVSGSHDDDYNAMDTGNQEGRSDDDCETRATKRAKGSPSQNQKPRGSKSSKRKYLYHDTLNCVKILRLISFAY